MDTQNSVPGSEPFAIVGLSLKLPQHAIDEPSLWKVLENGESLMTDWPPERATLDSFTDGVETGGRNTVKAHGAHFVKEDPAAFDAPFFSVPAKEAAVLNPQHRWALEAAYHAFENAGIPAENLRGSRTGVYAAYMTDDYMSISLRDPDQIPRQSATCLSPFTIPNRVSWYFGMLGPSMLVETGCSSSLAALDMACNAMRSGDADMALVLGTNLLLSPDYSIILSNMNFLSPDSRSYSFDARANGYSRGEGVVALVLKPLHSALENGDVIRAVVRSTGQNQDGRTPILTQPSAKAHEALIRQVYAKAGLNFEDTRYFEAHGTGTPTGDVIEMTGIGSVFGQYRSPQEPLYVGSIKTNVGHLEGTSALAGFLKAIMILERGVIPRNALFDKMNPKIDADSYNIQIPVKNIPWPSSGLRRVSVNSFGVGGSNAHAILDDAYHYLKNNGLVGYHHCVVESSLGDRPMLNGATRFSGEVNDSAESQVKLLVWSAADAAAVQRMLKTYEQYFGNHIAGEPSKLDQLAYTLATRRSLMAWRTFSVVDAETREFSAAKAVRSSSKGGIAFVFTGQGAQYTGMGLELRRYAVFDASLRRSDELLASFGCEWSLFDKLNDTEDISTPKASQPLLTALQVALVDLLRYFGVLPAVVLGHSSGEIAAAYTVGAVTHASALKLAYWRGQLSEQLRVSGNGAMMSVNLNESQVPEYLERAGLGKEALYTACINSQSNVTLSGPPDAIDTLKRYLQEEQIFAQKVNTGVAYHSPVMRAGGEEYIKRVGYVEPGELTKVPMISSVTGHLADPKLLATPQYWTENQVSPVLFSKAIQRLGDALPLPLGVDAITDIVEIGPHPALRRPTKDNISALSSGSTIRYHSTLERNRSPQTTMASVSGMLFCHGHPVNIAAVNGQAAGNLPFLIDCPPYPFDRSKKYWNEGRLSKDFRLRPHSTNHLLGRRTNDWNSLHPRWRNWLCVETMPWLGDHIISGAVVCPGAGMIVMALEAVKQMVVIDSRTISGFLVKNGQLLAPITVGETEQDATETELHLRPVTRPYEKEAKWFEVRIFSFRKGRWTENFHAEIQAHYDETHLTEVGGGREAELQSKQVRNHVEKACSNCCEAIDAKAFYSYCDQFGSRYREAFQLLENMKWDGGTAAMAQINMNLAKSYYPPADSPVHPAVLDAAIHLLFSHLSKGLKEPIPTLAPQRFSSFWISSKVWDLETTSIHILNEIQNSSRSISTSLVVETDVYVLADDGSPLGIFEGVALAEVARAQHQDSDGFTEHLLYGISWKPQLSTLSPQGLQQICDAVAKPNDESATVILYQKLEHALAESTRRALQLVTSEHLEKLPAFLRKYTISLQQQHESGSFSKYPRLDDDAFESLLVECETDSSAPSFIPVVARNLETVLLGETILAQLLSSTYTDTRSAISRVSGSLVTDGGLSHFLDLASHENPRIRLLEVGGGDGAMARQILNTLQAFEAETGQERFSTYTFTDCTPTAFNELRKEFVQWQERMTFKMLDLEHAPLDHGFEAFGYDLIVASHTSHATRSLKKALSHLHSLLRPGGRLVLVEAVSPESAILSVGFGCLEDWWTAEEPERQQGPVVAESRWDELMRETGFSGIDLVIRDRKDAATHYSSIMVATALDMVAAKSGSSGELLGRDIGDQPELFILIDATSSAQSSLAADLVAEHLAAEVLNVAQGLELDWTPSQSAIIISLLEIEKAYVADLLETDFTILKHVLQKAQQVLWAASAPGGHGRTTDPRYLVATGLLRTIRSEDPDKHLVMLNVEPSDHASRLKFVSQVLQICFLDQKPSAEAEFVVHDGHLNIARMIREENLDEERLDRIRPRLRNEEWQMGRPLALEIAAPGLLDSLRFKEDLIYQTELGPDEVEIKAEAWPVAFRDIFIALGRLGREELGIECAGRVTRLGSACTSLEVGDRVVMVTPGCMRSHPRSSSEKVMKIPDELSIFEAVSVLNPGLTAYHALTTIARLQPGEKILIHSAAGSTGQFAVGIAKMIGAEIFATVGYDNKKELLMDRFGIPEDHIFWSRNTSFAKGIKRITNGYGVDVVLNSLSGDGLTASWECIAPFGRFVEIGKADIGANTPLQMGSFAKNVSFSAVDLFHISQTNFRLLRQLMSQVLELATREGFLGNPRPLHVYRASEVEKAFRYMQSGKNTGRIIISVEDTEVVPKFITHQTSWRFAENASYLVVGGLGGLGRPIIRWMASRGARSLILPSRSGAASKAAIEVVKELEDKGVRVLTPRCDVSSANDFTAMLSELANTSPAVQPIKGCINSAMDLQDSVFENMTYSQWHRAIQSKVKTSWNLHELLPELDFFIMLASIVGIYGSAGQSNYAAGCAFQDALARYRTEAGHHTSVSLDLGWMRDDGAIRESADLQRRFTTATDLKPVATADLLALLDHYCDPALPPLTPDQSQVLVGISTPSEVRARGRDDSWARGTRLYSGFDVAQATGANIARHPLAGEDAAQLFRQADTPEERAKIVSTALREKLAKAMGIAIDEIDIGKGLADYGVDSLMAVELRNWIRRDFGVSLAVFEIMDGGRKVQDMGALVESKAER